MGHDGIAAQLFPHMIEGDVADLEFA